MYKVRLFKYVIWYVNNKFGNKGNVFVSLYLKYKNKIILL